MLSSRAAWLVLGTEDRQAVPRAALVEALAYGGALAIGVGSAKLNQPPDVFLRQWSHKQS